MSKRFSDTDKWKKPFIKSLPVEYKLFWLYLLDECDNAGIWHVELDLAEIRLGTKLSLQKIRGFFKERIVEFDNETKWFLPDFISFQYGLLDEKNRAHKSVIDKLSKYGLIKNKGHTSSLQGAKDKDMDMDKDMDKEGGPGGFLWTDVKQNFFNSDEWLYQFCSEKNLNKAEVSQKMREFITDLDLKGEHKDLRELKSHFTNWFNKQKKLNGSSSKQESQRNAVETAIRIGQDEFAALRKKHSGD